MKAPDLPIPPIGAPARIKLFGPFQRTNIRVIVGLISTGVGVLGGMHAVSRPHSSAGWALRSGGDPRRVVGRPAPVSPVRPTRSAVSSIPSALIGSGLIFRPPRNRRLHARFCSCEGWWTHDHRATRGWPLLKAGRPVVVEHDVASDDERQSLPYYRDLLSRHDLPWWASCRLQRGRAGLGLPILRSSTQGAFTATDVEELARAAPHLARMVSLASKLALAQGRGALDALERIGLAAFVLDRTGQVRHRQRAGGRDNRLCFHDNAGPIPSRQTPQAIVACATSSIGPFSRGRRPLPPCRQSSSRGGRGDLTWSRVGLRRAGCATSSDTSRP